MNLTCSQAIGMAALGAAVLGFFFGALSHRQWVRLVIRSARLMEYQSEYNFRSGVVFRMLNGGPLP